MMRKVMRERLDLWTYGTTYQGTGIGSYGTSLRHIEVSLTESPKKFRTRATCDNGMEKSDVE